jgi:hypothetical protein
MNDLYNKTIVVDGVVYCYDPDQDIYYRRYDTEESLTSRYGWIIAVVIMAAVSFYIELNQ